MFDPNKFKKKVMAGAGKKKVSVQGKSPVKVKVSTSGRKAGKTFKQKVTQDTPLTGERKIQVECAPGKAELPPMREVKEFPPNDLIIESRFCMGCIRNSVDHLGTNQEIWFCRRDPDKDGNVDFVMIKNTYKVKQCIWRKESFGGKAPF